MLGCRGGGSYVTRALTVFVLAVASPGLAQVDALGATSDGAGRFVTLEELIAHAATHAPTARVAEARQAYAEAARIAGQPRLRSNPAFSIGIGPRYDGANDRDFDFQTSLSQPVEVAGERRLRLDAADRLGDRLEAESALSQWELRRLITMAYHDAVVATAYVEVATRLSEFSEAMRDVAARRFAGGDATLLDVRVAESDLARARQVFLLAARDARIAGLRLCELTGWPVESPPRVQTTVRAPTATPSLDDALRAAAESHPELLLRRAATAEAQAAVELADREVAPTPIFGVQFSREGSAGSPANYILLGSVGMTLPLWQQNRGERARARVDEGLARLEEDIATNALRARVARAHTELASAAERLRLFLDVVSPSLEENLALTRRAVEAGELSIMTAAGARERFLEAERDSLAAYRDYFRARVELDNATGAEFEPPTP